MIKRLVSMLLLAVLFAAVTGCQTSDITNLLNPDCLVAGALSEEEYDDLPFWEQVLYEKNSCGLYVKTDLGTAIDEWF